MSLFVTSNQICLNFNPKVYMLKYTVSLSFPPDEGYKPSEIQP